MTNDLRLNEDYQPIEAVSAEASRKNSIHKGRISTLHLWRARRPSAACPATGVVRMKREMQDHGLEPPGYSYRDGQFVITFRGRGKSLHELKAKRAVPVFEVQPSVAETLNPNQKTILRELLAKDHVHAPELASTLGITAQAVRKDLARLQKLNLIEKHGAARATYYVLKERKSSP